MTYLIRACPDDISPLVLLVPTSDPIPPDTLVTITLLDGRILKSQVDRVDPNRLGGFAHIHLGRFSRQAGTLQLLEAQDQTGSK